MAAGIMRAIYEERGIAGVIESAGTADWNGGSPADYRAIKVALESGIDIRAHRARQVRRDDFERFDLVVAMDQHNHKVLRAIVPVKLEGKLRHLLVDTDMHGRDVPDPYHGSEATFRETFVIIQEGCTLLADSLHIVS